MKRLLAVAVLLLTASVARAEINWSVFVTKNNDVNNTQVVVPSTGTTHLDLAGIPVKAEVTPVDVTPTKDGINILSRLVTLEFLDGSGAAAGTFCPETIKDGQGNEAQIMVRRYNVLYVIVIQCLQIPEAKQ